MTGDQKILVLLQAIAIAFIFLFVYTAVSKLADLRAFRFVLNEAPLIGAKAELISIILPLSEIAVALLLFFPRTRTAGLYGSFFLMLVFTLYLAYMLVFAPYLPCSCGGVIGDMTWKQHLVFNGVLTIMAGWGCMLAKRRGMLSNNAEQPVTVTTG